MRIFTENDTMVNYVVKQSLEELKYVYSRLVDKVDEHRGLLAENGKPFLSFVGMKKDLLRLKLDYLSQKPINKHKITESEYLLINKIIQNFQIDVSDAVEFGLVCERDMKKALILKTYHEMAKTGLKYIDIKQKLSGEYGITVSAIEKMVYRKPPLSCGHHPPSIRIPSGQRGRKPTAQ